MQATARAAPLEDGIWGVNRDTVFFHLKMSFLSPQRKKSFLPPQNVFLKMSFEVAFVLRSTSCIFSSTSCVFSSTLYVFSCSCGRLTERNTGRDRQRRTDTDRDRQRQTETETELRKQHYRSHKLEARACKEDDS